MKLHPSLRPSIVSTALCALAFATACDDELASSAPVADASAADVSSADGADAEPPEDAEPPPEPVTFLTVIDTMAFAAADESGRVAGFDLDGRTSPAGERDSCGHGDAVDPEGREGIDNQLATLVPLFELAGIGAAEGLIQGAIADGGLILMLQVDGVDSLEDDPEVTLMLRAGTGVPLLGTDGKLLAGQTFALHPESPDSVAPVARIQGGVLEAGPFFLRLPISVFGVSYTLTMHDARIRATWTEDGGMVEGVLGGAVPYDDLLEVGRIAAMDDGSVLPTIELLFEDAIDMAPDEEGVCTRISGAFRFTAVSGFLF
jgi:hypothetical protein